MNPPAPFNFKQRLLFIFMFIFYMIFSYNVFGQWWNSSIGTILIIIFGYFIWKEVSSKILGIKIQLKIIPFAIIIAAVIALISFKIMTYLGSSLNIFIYPPNWKSAFHISFYVLNEEVILGGIALFYYAKRLKLNPIAASVSLAVLFSLIHFIFYKWIFLDRGNMLLITLITLFFIGVLRNNIILISGNIAFSWALHAGWMAIMFGGTHVIKNTEKSLSELQKFNNYLGSRTMFFISLILALVSLAILMKYNFPDTYNKKG